MCPGAFLLFVSNNLNKLPLFHLIGKSNTLPEVKDCTCTHVHIVLLSESDVNGTYYTLTSETMCHNHHT